MAITKFERTEKKYLLTAEQFDKFSVMLSDKMVIDQYGLHTISNIYYDTDDYHLIRASIEKPEYKEKLRVRSYGIPTAQSPVFVELKKKCGGVVFKRREQMTLEESERFLTGSLLPESPSQIVKEIDYFIKLYHCTPKLFLAYDRMALYGKNDPGLRMTFDRNIRFRQTGLDLSLGTWGTPLRTDKSAILEIKLCGAMPMWLTRLLTELKIYPASFSKYGTVFKEYIAPKAFKKGVFYCA